MIHYKKFPFTEHQGKLPCSEKPSRNSGHQSNTFYPNLPNHFINTDFYNIFKSACSSIVSTVNRMYNGQSVVSNLGSSKRPIFFPKHPDQLQHPPSLQLNDNQSFISSSKVARADSLTTHIYLEPSL